MRRTAWVRALVTGASSGIGRAMAQELARGGTALVLVAPDGDRLAELAGSLPTEVEVLVADLTDPQQLHTVGQRCAATERPVDLLVNNAGIWSFGPLTGPAGDAAERMVALNVGAVVALSRAAGRQMVDRGRGSILNVSSVAASQPAPFEAVYAASKTFVAIFGQALHEELRGTGVTVTTVTPGMTRTELHASRWWRGAVRTRPRLAVDGAADRGGSDAAGRGARPGGLRSSARLPSRVCAGRGHAPLPKPHAGGEGQPPPSPRRLGAKDVIAGRESGPPVGIGPRRRPRKNAQFIDAQMSSLPSYSFGTTDASSIDSQSGVSS